MPYWLALLHDELAEFETVPVVSLGQPLLKALVLGDASPLVRDYWAYRPGWKSGERGEKRCLGADENRLQRVVFPFPHQPSAGKRFYKQRMEEYLAFVWAEPTLA